MLPSHLPLLEHFWLRTKLLAADLPSLLLPQLAHPTVRHIDLYVGDAAPSEDQMRVLNQQLVHSVRLPNLERIGFPSSYSRW